MSFETRKCGPFITTPTTHSQYNLDKSHNSFFFKTEIITSQITVKIETLYIRHPDKVHSVELCFNIYVTKI